MQIVINLMYNLIIFMAVNAWMYCLNKHSCKILWYICKILPKSDTMEKVAVLKERRLSLHLIIYVTFNERIILQNNYSSVILDTILMQKIILGKGKKGLTRMSLYIVRVVAVGLVIKVRSISWLKIRLLYYRLMSNMHMERTKWIPGVSIGYISVARAWLCSPP